MTTPKEKFRIHFSNLDRRGKFDLVRREFIELKFHPNETDKKFSPRQQIGSDVKNRDLNRYRDIIPYDHTRVKLDNCNYINASWIGKDKAYIATQGPKDRTVRHFWELVLQHEIEIIVMLCRLREASHQPGIMKDKCASYWPHELNEVKTIDGENKMDKLKVTLESEETLQPSGHKLRRMKVQSSKYKIRTVWQFQMTNWPDHGVPDNSDDVRNLIAAFRHKVKSPKVPILLHCSAGVGRTGTVIAIDRVMQQLKKNSLDSNFTVLDLVKDLRKFRPKMCQTEEQYRFIYEFVEELLGIRYDSDENVLPVTDGLNTQAITHRRDRKGRPKSERRKRDKDPYLLSNGFERRSSERGGRPFSDIYGSRELAKINRPLKQAHRRKSKSAERLDIPISGIVPVLNHS